VLAWAGIETGLVNSASLRTVNDKQVPLSPRKITLRQALFYSSNDYFYPFVQEIGIGPLTSFVQESHVFPRFPAKEWIGPDPKMVVRGGVMKTTPALNHAFMIRVASGTLTGNPEFQTELEKAMFWPSPDSSVKLYGKTGTVSGAVWFNGFGKTSEGTKVVTVFIPGGLEDRPRTIQLFFEAFNLKWDQALIQQVEEQ
jgi:hypothetical protein